MEADIKSIKVATKERKKKKETQTAAALFFTLESGSCVRGVGAIDKEVQGESPEGTYLAPIFVFVSKKIKTRRCKFVLYSGLIKKN